MCSSKTQEARDLFKELQEADKDFPSIGLYKHSDGWVWVAHKQRAYFVEELGRGHLDRLIAAMKERHPDELRKPLEDEAKRRVGLVEQEQLRKFINTIDEVRSTLSNIDYPEYLTNEQLAEWRSILARDVRELGQTIEKAAYELDKEEWYASN